MSCYKSSPRGNLLLSLLFTWLSISNLINARVVTPSDLHGRQVPSLKTGAYIITYQPTDPDEPLYKGPLRVTTNSTATLISGDLYNGTVVPDPADGSPILPRANYWAFVRGVSYEAGSNRAFSLGLEYWNFEGLVRRARYNETVWAREPLDGGYTMDLAPAAAPSGYPDADNYFEGDVKTADGQVTGHFTMGWVSNYLRRITVEIGTAPGLEVPLDTESGEVTWKTVFDDVDFDVDVIIGETNIPEPNNPDLPPGMFTNAQQNNAMHEHRTPTNFDEVWKYYLLVVRLIENQPRGEGIEPIPTINGRPREGAVIASEWIVGTTWDGQPDTRHEWEPDVVGKKFVELHDAWFRTAVHEIGHMFNLQHPFDFGDGDIMVDTETYVDAGVEGLTPERWPDNVTPASFRFRDSDLFLMQHRPDTHVRPGWIDWGAAAQYVVPPPVVALSA